jgi:hypothetical protein
MEPIIFDKKGITAFAEILFGKITILPAHIRPDDKERTGIQILVRELSPLNIITSNIVVISVRQPSDAAQHLVHEKAVRSAMYGDSASQNTADSNKLQYAGCVTFTLPDARKIQVSTSGLKAEEDVAVAIVLLAYILNCGIKEVVKNILDSGGKLPEFITKPPHYLFDFLADYGYQL